MRFLVVPLFVTLAGCGLLYDFDPADDAGGPARFDAGRPDSGIRPIDASRPFDASPCGGGEGATCGPSDGTNRICLGGLCVPSVCGDFHVDTNLGETCELDQPDCVACGLGDCQCPEIELPCREPVCSGTECLFVPLVNGSPCSAPNGNSGECVDGVCSLRTCGDGNLDTGEDCDDANGAHGDGCENDCTFTCITATDCDDFNPCNGVETCSNVTDPAERICGPGASGPTIPPCDVCDSEIGVHTPDSDGDGYAADVGQPCPAELLDCNDSDASIHPSAGEICDGIDNDCNPSTAEPTSVSCGADMDEDGWAAMGALTSGVCGETTCPAGMTPVRSNDGTVVFDCDDDDENVHPAQSAFFTAPRGCTVGTPGCAHAFDYNCDGAGEREDLRVEHCTLLDAPCSGAGWVSSPPACGVNGRFANCIIPLVCVPAPRDRTQACR